MEKPLFPRFTRPDPPPLLCIEPASALAAKGNTPRTRAEPFMPWAWPQIGAFFVQKCEVDLFHPKTQLTASRHTVMAEAHPRAHGESHQARLFEKMLQAADRSDFVQKGKGLLNQPYLVGDEWCVWDLAFHPAAKTNYFWCCLTHWSWFSWFILFTCWSAVLCCVLFS